MELVLAVECGVGSALDGLVLIDRDTLTDAPPDKPVPYRASKRQALIEEDQASAGVDKPAGHQQSQRRRRQCLAQGLQRQHPDPAEEHVEAGPDALRQPRQQKLSDNAEAGHRPDQTGHADGPATLQDLGRERCVGPRDHQEISASSRRRRKGRAGLMRLRL